MNELRIVLGFAAVTVTVWAFLEAASDPTNSLAIIGVILGAAVTGAVIDSDNWVRA